MANWIFTAITILSLALAQIDPKVTIDLEILTLQPIIATYQTTYAAARSGRYYQMLWSHSAPPDDGRNTTADRLATKPTDQTETGQALWDALGRATSAPFRLRIDTYDGPQGRGYITYYQVEIRGVVWERAIDAGPESRSNDWYEAE